MKNRRDSLAPEREERRGMVYVGWRMGSKMGERKQGPRYSSRAMASVFSVKEVRKARNGRGLGRRLRRGQKFV